MKRVLSTGLITSLILASQAHALPILRESAGQYNSTFVTIYPDHRDSNLFYFLPNSMKFARDPSTGVPSFSLNTYAVEQSDVTKAHGWLTFVFRAAITPDVQAALDAFKREHPGATLATLPIGESYMTVGNRRDGTPGGGGSEYFKSWDLPPNGGVLESEVGGNAFLTGFGAKMMTKAIRDTSTPWALNYCFVVDGVTPMMDAEVTIDYQRVYSHFRASLSAGWGWFGSTVQTETQKLTENGAINIKLHGDTKFEDVVMQMARDLAKDYMTPKLSLDGSPASGDIMDKTPFRMIRFGFNHQSVEERHTVTLNIRKQADIKDSRCISAPFRELAPFADKVISNTTL